MLLVQSVYVQTECNIWEIKGSLGMHSQKTLHIKRHSEALFERILKVLYNESYE